MQPHIYLNHNSGTVFQYFEEKGLDKRQCEEVRDFLNKTYALTGREWRPLNCANIPDLTELVNKALHSVRLKEFSDFEAMHVNKRHFFLASNLIAGETFIFDPTGVPKDYSQPLENIQPYFGLVESAVGNHLQIYRERQPYTRQVLSHK